MAPLPASDLAQATMMLEAQKLHLAALGFGKNVTEAGVRRAWGIADRETQMFSAALRGAAFRERLAYELNRCEAWCTLQRTAART